LNRAVLDASVAAKWFLSQDEPLASEAEALKHEYDLGKIVFLVPDLFWAEIANVVWKTTKQGRVSRELARAALDFLRSKGFATVSSINLIDTALDLALRYDRGTYDCIYVALALASNCQFITADERLANAVAAKLPVKWLGAL
jgi:predicted nucleic acid-binding protein